MGITLAAAIAGGRLAHQAGIHPVLHIAGQDAVLDQHGTLCRRAFVIDGQRTAALGHGAVIDHGDALCRNLLAHAAGKGRSAATVEIAFQAVADGFVQQHGRPARTQHHIEHACRSVDGVQIDPRHAQRLVGQRFPGVGRDPAVELGPSAGAGRAGLAAAIAFDRDLHVEPDEGADIGLDVAIGPDDRNVAARAGNRGGYLDHAGILGAAVGVDLLQQAHLGVETGIGDRVDSLVELAVGTRRRRGQNAGMAALDGAGRLRRAPDRVQGRIGGMGIAEGFARHAAQAETARAVEAGRLQAAIVEDQGFRLGRFQKELAVIGAGHGVGEDGGDVVGIELELADRAVGHADTPCGLVPA